MAETRTSRERSFLDRTFGLAENGTTVRTEFVAGATTFLTMVYIVFVNPEILANAGMDRGAVFVATCLAAAISTLVMALYANYPIALAPGMGLNAFFAFTLVLGYKYSWQQALAFVFISGVLALIITATRLRETIINAIPQNLKLAVSAGVGLFLGIIALQQSGIVVDHPATLVTLGNLKAWPALLALAGFVLIVVLNSRKVLGGTLIGILAVTLIGIPLGLVSYGGIVSMPPSLAPTFLQLDFSRVFEEDRAAGDLHAVVRRPVRHRRHAGRRQLPRRFSRRRRKAAAHGAGAGRRIPRRPWWARCSAPPTPRAISRVRRASRPAAAPDSPACSWRCSFSWRYSLHRSPA